MSGQSLSGEEVIRGLSEMEFRKVRQSGSHAILKYKNPDTGEVRTVAVPLDDELSQPTLKGIAESCGAQDFQKWRSWIHDRIDSE